MKIDTNLNNTYDQENSHIINTLSEFTSAITDFRDHIINEGKSESLFFRGQSDILWDIRPSIFRDSLISAEYKIIQTAMTRAPHEFKECTSSFEELTKLQHYGLPTRLLDVTMNPLVALYFACNSSAIIKDEEGNETYNNGIVYVCQGYGEHDKSLKTRILSAIAKLDIPNGSSLKNIKDEIDITEIHNPEDFISYIQDTIFVMPSYSNTRLVRQSGAFLITGAINVIIDEEDIWNSKVSKSIKNLNEEMDKSHIIISGEAKPRILDELDFFNINESTLFPELEHQMSHIKRVGSKWVTTECGTFVKHEQQSKIEKVSDINSNKQLSDEIIQIILNKNITVKKARPEIKKIILETIEFPDWSTKENIYNILIMKIKRTLKSFGNTNAKNIANIIVNELINKAKEP